MFHRKVSGKLADSLHKESINGSISQFQIDKVAVCIIILKEESETNLA